MKEITVKDLIGMSKLTLEQAKKYLEHPNYSLKGSPIAIIKNDSIDPETMITGELEDVSVDGEISFRNEGICTFKPALLDVNTILIIFPKDKPAQAVFM